MSQSKVTQSFVMERYENFCPELLNLVKTGGIAETPFALVSTLSTSLVDCTTCPVCLRE